MKNIIKAISNLEEKQDKGVITFDEQALLNNLYDFANSKLFSE